MRIPVGRPNGTAHHFVDETFAVHLAAGRHCFFGRGDRQGAGQLGNVHAVYVGRASANVLGEAGRLCVLYSGVRQFGGVLFRHIFVFQRRMDFAVRVG